MPRLPYVYPEPGVLPEADELRKMRRKRQLHALDGIFLNAPALAKEYNRLFAQLWKPKLNGAIRELLVGSLVVIPLKRSCLNNSIS